MDRNIAALMREDARTIHITFDPLNTEFDPLVETKAPTAEHPGGRQYARYPQGPKAKEYTYVTDLALARGDTVVVEAAGKFCLAFVESVDDDVQIEPNADKAFKWVVAKVDMHAYAQNMVKNKQIDDAVAEAYRNNLRKNFSQQILAGVTDEQRQSLTLLISAPKA